MIKISEELVEALMNQYIDYIGYFSEEYGAVIGDKEFIIWEIDSGAYLIHKSELEHKDLVITEGSMPSGLVRLKNEVDKINSFRRRKK